MTLHPITKLLRMQKAMFKYPARVLVAGFLLLIAAGTLMLMHPAAAVRSPLTFMEALFTATSGACVTGLSVIDAGQRLSLFGQLTLLALIQVGGLGIMTISTMVILMAGGRAGLASRNIIQDTYTGSGEQKSSKILKNVILYTLFIEGAGAILLFTRFIFDFSFKDAAYISIFHSVSAFCNAGFSLMPDSLSQYRGDFIINATISLLIISGGIGFLVMTEIREMYRRPKFSWSRLSLHTRIATVSSAILIILGTVLFLLTEQGNTLAGLPFTEKLFAAFFQSVSTRTAGFNTVDISSLTNETISFFMLFMFIGACPGSCAGGVKTTTLAALVLHGFSKLRGKKHTEIFGRTIPERSVTRSANIVMLGAAIVIAGVMILFSTEADGISQITGHRGFAEIIFEVVSAFGTAGISMGITSSLSTAGKLVIAAIMFIGRLGPLMVAVALSRQIQSRVKYAEENIMTG